MRLVIHVQLSGGYLPYDSTVVDSQAEAIAYLQNIHDASFDDAYHAVVQGIAPLTNDTHATVEPFDPDIHSELLEDNQ